MRIVHFEKAGVPGIAADDGSGWHGLTERESGFPGTLPELIVQGADLLRTGRDLLPMHAIDLNAAFSLGKAMPSRAVICTRLLEMDDSHGFPSVTSGHVHQRNRFVRGLSCWGEPR